MMPLWVAALVFAALCVAVYVVLFRHRHHWSAWGEPTAQGYQHRRCKDRDCNRHQIKDVFP